MLQVGILIERQEAIPFWK